MEFIVNNWILIIVALAVISVCAYVVYAFIKKPTNEQITRIKEWLLYAVAAAEKELGSGTGQLKLRYVYDMFLAKFGYMSQVISFEMFSMLVDEALDKFKKMLESNPKLQTYIQKEE